MDLHISVTGRRGSSAQIYRQVREAILDGRLRAREPLPPSRELAGRLGVSRNTVNAAYERLAAEGFVASRVGSGTFVHSAVPAPAYPPASSETGAGSRALTPRAMWDAIPEAVDVSATPEFDFRAGVPDADLFPYQTWRRLVARELTRSRVGSGMYGEPAGLHALRAAIARHVGLSRGVAATADDVLVTNGIQQAVDLIGRVLLEPGACVAFENPGYLPVREPLEAHGARIVTVPIDGEGLVVDALPPDTRLLYVTPAHQFPLGVTMSLRRRMDLLAWAKRHNTAVIEDDYDSEFRYGGRPIEPLHSLDRAGVVVYVGSFSKVMLPTLRLGFVVAPPPLHRALRVAKYTTDWHTALPTQAALARFIDDGLLARHVRRMRNHYRMRHERIVAALADEFVDTFAVIPSTAGMHLGAFARNGTSDDMIELRNRAAAVGVGIFDFGMFSRQDVRPGLIFGYGGISATRIDAGLDRLRTCLSG